MAARGNAALLSLALLSLVGLAGPVRADETDDAKARAAALLDEGNKLFAAKRFEAARARYAAAFSAYASPKIRLNLAEASRELGDLVRAVDDYQRFVDEAHPTSNAKQLELARTRIAEIDRQLGRIALEGAAGTEVTLDGRTLGALPLDPVRVMAGRHTVIAQRFREDVMVRSGGSEIVRIEPADAPSSALASGDPVSGGPASPQLTPPIEAAGPALVVAPAKSEDDAPVYTSGWFWAGVGVLVTSAVVVGVAASIGGDDFVPGGELGRVSTANWTSFTPGAGP